MIEHFYTTPRLAILSPEAGSGKTRVLEVLDLLVRESMFVFNASPAAIFRSLSEEPRTLLFDEIDTIWNMRGREEGHEDLRALINAGYKKGATIPRCTGKDFQVMHFDAFSAVALAGIGHLPDTIRTRSIIIKMRRRAPNESVESFRSRRQSPIGRALNARLTNWAALVGEKVGNAWPKMPDGVVDRNEEIWEPLIAIADEAGGEWPEVARQACLHLVKDAERQDSSLGIQLLRDLRALFMRSGQGRLSTAYLIDMLTGHHSGLPDDAPWETLDGNGVSSRKLAVILKEYDIAPKKMRIGGDLLNGYSRDMFEDAWSRYLPADTSQRAEHTEQAEHCTERVGEGYQVVPDVPDVLGIRGKD
jgi:hypothetical protein